MSALKGRAQPSATGMSHDMSLSLVGMRIGPVDPATKTSKVGLQQEVVKPDYSRSNFNQRILKTTSGFSGGFKIPEDYRKKRGGRMGYRDDEEEEDDLEGTQMSQITKDEIFQHLNLGHSEAGIGVGRHGTGSKVALAKDLVEGIEKDLEKLKRQQENLQMRRTMATKGGQSYVEQTDEEKKRELEMTMKGELEEDNAFVIDVNERKIQAMRHQASQLGSHANMSLEELEQMRKENEERLKQLEEVYFKKKMNASVGKAIREKMGYTDEEPKMSSSRGGGGETLTFGQDDPKSDKKKKSVRIAGEQEYDFGLQETKQKQMGTAQLGLGAQPAKPMFDGRRAESRGRAESRSRSKKREEIVYDSPRRKLYEAKFEKYLANKENKMKQDKKLSALQKEDFERYMQGTQSPSKQTKRYSASKKGKSFDAETLIPKSYEEEVLKQTDPRTIRESGDQFKLLGVLGEDKMTYFLLKWVFNAIKRESTIEEPKLNGNPYVTKQDLVKQLSKNDELMGVLGFQTQRDIANSVKHVVTAKEGCLMWEEFLDLFFLKRQTNQQERGLFTATENWWRLIGKEQPEEKQEQLTTEGGQVKQSPEKKTSNYMTMPRYGRQDQSKNQMNLPRYEDPDKKPVRMTESLKHLKDVRHRKVEEEVEEEFQALAERKQQEKKSPSKIQESVLLPDEDAFGFKREKSQCLLLQSQVQIMQDIFEAMDKYHDQILRRSDFILQLRTDERVVDFIDVSAVKVPYSKKVLTLDEVLAEVEKDELFEMTQLAKSQNPINHKEFITWREFMTYFDDYREIEERNQKTKQLYKARQSFQKTISGEEQDASVEITTLMEQEKQRRLQELPKLRPADQIDITEKQLQLLKDIYDSLPRAQTQKEMVHTIEFFLAMRKNPQIRTISTTIARDPEGVSRIPRETFQQVFDRMENELQGQKQIEWAQIVEYFTKRGRPLTKDEIQRLIDEDRRQREAEEQKKRADEEAERRRMARLMEDLEEQEDIGEQPVQERQTVTKGILKQTKETRMEDRDDFDSDEDDDEELERGDGQGDGYVSDPELMTAQRHYDFGDRPRQRNKSAKGRSRQSPSGKSMDEKNLRHVKLTTQDYMDNGNESKKKGKYGVTVPKPFKFDMRDSTRPKGIRQQKLDEMVAEKRLEEENVIKHQFKHNPIPPQVIVPRYQAIMDANEQRRLTVKQNSIAITKKNEKPFSFYYRDLAKQQPDPEEYLCDDLKKQGFKANPIPRACSVLIFDQMMKKQQQEREERIRKNAELNFAKAKLPERMQMHEEKKKQMPQTKSEVDFYSFKPSINELVTKEQFMKKQESFMNQLSKKKAQKTQTRPKSPNFTKKQSKGLEREYLNENYGQTGGARSGSADKFKNALAKTIAKSIEEKAAANPSSTKGTNLAMKRRREELEAKKKKEEEKKKEDEERKQRQNRLKNVVQGALQERVKDETQKRKDQLDQKINDGKKEFKRNQQAIKERVDAGRQRPLLIESSYGGKKTSNLDKIKATKVFVDTLKKNNVNPDHYLTEDQKEIMDKEEYVQQKMKEYGRI